MSSHAAMLDPSAAAGQALSIVPTIDWTFPIVHLFLGDTPWTRSELSPLGGIVPS